VFSDREPLRREQRRAAQPGVAFERLASGLGLRVQKIERVEGLGRGV